MVNFQITKAELQQIIKEEYASMAKENARAKEFENEILGVIRIGNFLYQLESSNYNAIIRGYKYYENSDDQHMKIIAFRDSINFIKKTIIEKHT